jgi:hypothetical protein
MTGDFDGDAKTDIAYAYACGAGNTYLCFDIFRSTGSGFVLETWGSAGNNQNWQQGTDWQAASTFVTGDFNGDGLTDIAYI